MVVNGEASINVQVVYCYVEIMELVTPDLSAQMLLSWHDLVKLGILHSDFLNPIPREALHVISHGNDPTPLPGSAGFLPAAHHRHRRCARGKPATLPGSFAGGIDFEVGGRDLTATDWGMLV